MNSNVDETDEVVVGEMFTKTTSSYMTPVNMSILAGFVVYVCLFKIKNPLQLYVKYITYVTITMTVAVLFTPIAALRPLNPKNIGLVAKIITFLFKIFGVKVKLENEHYFKSDQPYVVIMNHQSSLDFMTMMNIWPGGNCTPLAKKELFYTWPFGFAIWLCGITFIDRLNPDRARGTIEKLAEKINKKNLRVWIFPEGTRSPNTRLLPFKKGAFHLAVQAQVPIVCVVTTSYSNFYNKRERKFLNTGEVKCKVLPPFQTKGLGIDAVSNLTKHLQTVMQRELDDLNREIGLDPKYIVAAPSAEEEETAHICEKHAKNRKQDLTSNSDDNNNSMMIPASSQNEEDDDYDDPNEMVMCNNDDDDDDLDDEYQNEAEANDHQTAKKLN